jgi:predicted amidohydrolase
MKIGIFQPNINHYSSIDSKLTKLEAILKQNDLELLVLPELFLSFYLSKEQVSKYTNQDVQFFKQKILQLSEKYQCHLVCGYPEFENNQKFNSAIVTGTQNDIIYNHRKTFLAPNPMEQSLFSKGQNFEIFNIHKIKCSTLICYEFEFPEIVRKLARLGAQLILVPTALIEEFKFVSDEMLKTRAFENQIVMVYANYCGQSDSHDFCGNSAIVNEKGEDLIRLGAEEEFAMAEVNFESQVSRRKRLPYFEDLTKFEV